MEQFNILQKRSETAPASLFLTCEQDLLNECSRNLPDESLHKNCTGILMFAKTESTCGCSINNPFGRRLAYPLKSGWSKFTRLIYFLYSNLTDLSSVDNCDGTGDHENYFKDVTEAWDIDGTKYTDCFKRAVSFRQKNEHLPLSEITKSQFFLSADQKQFYRVTREALRRNRNIINPKYS